MDLTQLTAISPIDGRYRKQVSQLADYFSEYGLIKYRVFVEVEYLFALAEKGIFQLQKKTANSLIQLRDEFSLEDALAIKNIEATTAHDVKAVEYFIKQKLQDAGEESILEWVHFGLTSQDINNTAIPLSWKQALEAEYFPALLNLNRELKMLAESWRDVPMLARTHGQPASPTRLGKEWMVYVERLENAIEHALQIPTNAKFGGATGNFNAHSIAFPKTDWVSFADDFVNEKLGLERLQFTTQIEHYDNLAASFDSLKRINTILIDFCRDVWTYISMDYFKQKTRAEEVGSSAMPHKVNPIDFENAEGNLGMANALLEHLAAKLPVSRLQRDLTDSTVLRNIGVPFSHIVIAFKSIEKGLGKLVLNYNKLEEDLENAWPVVAEAIQTILRREAYPNPYEALKELTRGQQRIDKKAIHSFVDSLSVSDKVKKELKAISPHNYIGVNPTY